MPNVDSSHWYCYEAVCLKKQNAPDQVIFHQKQENKIPVP